MAKGVGVDLELPLHTNEGVVRLLETAVELFVPRQARRNGERAVGLLDEFVGLDEHAVDDDGERLVHPDVREEPRRGRERDGKELAALGVMVDQQQAVRVGPAALVADQRTKEATRPSHHQLVRSREVVRDLSPDTDGKRVIPCPRHVLATWAFARHPSRRTLQRKKCECEQTKFF